MRVYKNSGGGGPAFSALELSPAIGPGVSLETKMGTGVVTGIVLTAEQARDLAAQMLAIVGLAPEEGRIAGVDYRA